MFTVESYLHFCELFVLSFTHLYVEHFSCLYVSLANKLLLIYGIGIKYFPPTG